MTIGQAIKSLLSLRNWLNRRADELEAVAAAGLAPVAVAPAEPSGDQLHVPPPPKSGPDISEGADDSPAKAIRRVSPSRTKAKAAYDYAIAYIPGAEKMTIGELFDAIMNHPSDASKALPPNAEAFGVYLREAGVKRYATNGGRLSGPRRR